MKLLYSKVFFSVSIILILIAAGCNTGNCPSFTTKEDSVNFATEVLTKYPQDSGAVIQKDAAALVVQFTEGTPNKSKADFMASEPIDWETILRYKDNYDKNPLLKRPDGRPYKGFIIDSFGLDHIRKIPGCTQVYLRFGQKVNGHYTLMLLPMKGRVLVQSGAKRADGEDQNLDHLDPCPDSCPDGFEDPVPLNPASNDSNKKK